MKNFFKGASFLWNGIQLFYSDRSLWKYALGAWSTLIVLYVSTIAVIVYCTGKLAAYLSQHLASYPDFLRSLLAGSLHLLAFVLAAVLILTTLCTFFEIFGSFFFDKLIEKVETKYYRTELPRLPLSIQLGFTFQSLCFGLKSTLYFLLLFILSFFLPLAGQLLLIVLMGFRMGVSLLIAVGFLRGKSSGESRQDFREHAMTTAGFGIVLYVLQLIPLALPLILPGAVVGAVMLWNGKLPEPEKNGSKTLPSP